ncbi:MAG: hypothetical protein HZB53_12255 [Chloroflexi bacterium]|nr:hypothetical protein [Chloroflexota bacterium]
MGMVTLARRYDPFGDALPCAGSGASAFGFAGEQMDATKLKYLHQNSSYRFRCLLVCRPGWLLNTAVTVMRETVLVF